PGCAACREAPPRWRRGPPREPVPLRLRAMRSGAGTRAGRCRRLCARPSLLDYASAPVCQPGGLTPLCAQAPRTSVTCGLQRSGHRRAAPVLGFDAHREGGGVRPHRVSREHTRPQVLRVDTEKVAEADETKGGPRIVVREPVEIGLEAP